MSLPKLAVDTVAALVVTVSTAVLLVGMVVTAVGSPWGVVMVFGATAAVVITVRIREER